MNRAMEHFIVSYYVNYQRRWWLRIIAGYLNTRKMKMSKHLKFYYPKSWIPNGSIWNSSWTTFEEEKLQKQTWWLYFGAEEQEKKRNRWRCTVCGSDHSLRACDGFKKMSVTEQWKVAKQGKLCYRCLPNNQFDSGCTRTRIPYSL